MSTTADVLVVGAGAVGASVAHHLAAAGAGKVMVVERESQPGTGSTRRCAGGFRHQFSSPDNIALSLASIPLITGFSDLHGIPLDVTTDGYLFLARSDATWARLQTDAALQASMGVDTRLLSPERAGALVPGLSLEELRGASFCADDGLADPAGLTNGYLTAGRRLGVVLALSTAALEVLVDGDGVSGVRTSAGTIATRCVVDAAGPWAAELAATAGVDLPVVPLARCVVVTAAFARRPEHRTLVVDTDSGFYMHREGDGVLMGMGASGERTGFDWSPPEEFLGDELIPAAIGTFPPLAGASLAKRWVGYYEMTPDAHPVLGPVDTLPGLVLANGFSGHGFQHAPIVGQLVAEWICEGAPRSVAVSHLGLGRFSRDGSPLRSERAVI